MSEHLGTPPSLQTIFPSMSRARGVPAHPGTPPLSPTPAHPCPTVGGHSVEALGLIEVLDALTEAGVSFDLDRAQRTPVLVFEPPLTPEAEALIEPVRLDLTYVALGRYTGHAPATCDRCGWVTMLATSDRTTARCLDSRCRGRRVVRDVEVLAVHRVRRAQGALASSRTRRRRS